MGRIKIISNQGKLGRFSKRKAAEWVETANFRAAMLQKVKEK